MRAHAESVPRRAEPAIRNIHLIEYLLYRLREPARERNCVRQRVAHARASQPRTPICDDRRAADQLFENTTTPAQP